jgi:hypothetical protein
MAVILGRRKKAKMETGEDRTALVQNINENDQTTSEEPFLRSNNKKLSGPSMSSKELNNRLEELT